MNPRFRTPTRPVLSECGESLAALLYFGLRHASCRFRIAARLVPLLECGNLLPLCYISECGTPRAALELRCALAPLWECGESLAAFELRHVPCRFRSAVRLAPLSHCDIYHTPLTGAYRYGYLITIKPESPRLSMRSGMTAVRFVRVKHMK